MVFWLGWTKKLKEAVSEKFVKKNYLNKVQREELQTVQSLVDFHNNIVAKREAFVDIVGSGDTNIPNLAYLKQKDTFGMIRIWIANIDQGKWQIEWIKKPSKWNDNENAIRTLHINTTYLNNGNLDFTTNAGFQEWNNFRIPNYATTNQINNVHFKDNTKLVFVYFYVVLAEKLGGRTLKVSQPLASKYDRTNWEFIIPVNMVSTTKDIRNEESEVNNGIIY